jgi:enhancer of mRNA-decapping protein 4
LKKEKSKPLINSKTTPSVSAIVPEGKISILKRDESALPPTLSSNAAATTAPHSTGSAYWPSDFEEILDRVLTSHSKKQHAFLVSEIHRTVRSEMETTVVPALSKAVQQSMDQSIFGPLKTDLAKMKKSARDHKAEIVEAVSAGVEEPLQTAFTESMQNVLIPAFESVTTRMFAQIATAVDTSLLSNNNPSKLEDLSANLASIASAVEKLSSQMEELRTTIVAQGPSDRKPPGLAGSTQVDKLQSKRDEILKLLSQKQYENAFIQALSASTADMAVFCCEQVTIADVLGNEKPALSQPILLCLMQQLGAALVTSNSPQKLQLEVLWLQEIALILDPSDRKIKQHVPNVLNELVTNITKKMANGDQSLRRPLEVLLRVIRGMQMG